MKTAGPSTIDEYIAQFPSTVQRVPQKIRNIVQTVAPDAQEAIKYGVPTFVLNGNLVHFAAYARHIGFYPTSSGIKEFTDELSAYRHAKGSVQFSLDKPIPLRLIRKIVQFRVIESRASLPNKAGKTKRKNGGNGRNI